MIKTTAKHSTGASKSGAAVTTSNSGAQTNFYGRHSSSTISPRKMAPAAHPVAFGRKSGTKNIKSTGGA